MSTEKSYQRPKKIKFSAIFTNFILKIIKEQNT